jgi:hypothetical protein
MEEQTADLDQWLARTYGGSVAAEYIDVFSPRMEQFPAVRQIIDRMNLPLPVIGFNGEARIAGGIALDMIGKELEKRGVLPG